MVTKLGSGRWRAQVRDPQSGKNVSVGKVLSASELRALDGVEARAGSWSFPTKTKARDAVSEARRRLERQKLPGHVTVNEFRDRWLTDPLFRRPKESSMLYLAERTKHFAGTYGDLPLSAVDDEVVARWLAGGKRNGQVPALRAMFNDAMSAKAGRVARVNPWAGLGLAQSSGNRHKDPPSEETVQALIATAARLEGPDFAAWLQVAASMGLRPGELDALRFERVDFENGRVQVAEQWNAAARAFSLPKKGARVAPLVPMAREALLAMRDLHGGAGFCFRCEQVEGAAGRPALYEHFTPGKRTSRWQRVRAAVGYEGTLYLATRHFAGWYMTNVLLLPSEDVAIALGHSDGGELVRRLYGHRERERALDRIVEAYAEERRRGRLEEAKRRGLRVVGGEEA